jgi:hypothetical protein
MVCRHVTVTYKCKIKKNTTSSKIFFFHKPPIIEYIFPPGYWKKLLLPGYWGRFNGLSMLLLKWSKTSFFTAKIASQISKRHLSAWNIWTFSRRFSRNLTPRETKNNSICVLFILIIWQDIFLVHDCGGA